MNRGMVTKKNTELMAELGYPYIVGYHLEAPNSLGLLAL